MAIQQNIFGTKDFNLQDALNKCLCAVVDAKDNIIGTGIVTTTNKGLVITISGHQYTFSTGGQPVNGTDCNLSLKMAESHLIENKRKSETVSIDSLNAKDQVALKVLGEMLRTIADPSAVSKNEITHYCEAAYLWATYMLAESKRFREEDSGSKESSEQIKK